MGGKIRLLVTYTLQHQGTFLEFSKHVCCEPESAVWGARSLPGSSGWQRLVALRALGLHRPEQPARTGLTPGARSRVLLARELRA